MKKFTIVLCMLLSLVLIACGEPDNNPGNNGNNDAAGRNITIVINKDIFKEEIRAQVTKVGFSYDKPSQSKALTETIKSDIGEDGTVTFNMFVSTAQDISNYIVTAYDADDTCLEKKSGLLNVAGTSTSITVDNTSYVPLGVVKILNSDLHFLGGQSYLISGFPAGDGYGKDPGKVPGKDPGMIPGKDSGMKPDEEAYYGINILVSDGEYTVLDGAFEFLQEHGSLQLEIINEIGWMQAHGVPRVHRMTPYFNAVLMYDKNKTEYIIDNSNAVKDRILEEETHEINITPQGEFIDELKYLYFYDDPDYVNLDYNKTQIEKTVYDDFFRYEGKFYGGRPYTYYVMGLDSNRKPITEMATIRFILPEVYDKSNELKPVLVSFAKVTIKNPEPGKKLLYTITYLNDDGTVDVTKTEEHNGVDIGKESITIYLPAGHYNFECKNDLVVEKEDMPTIDFEIKPNEIWTIEPVFNSGNPQVKLTKGENEIIN